MSKKLVIIGASGHGKVIADIAKRNGYHEIVFLDDNETIHESQGMLLYLAWGGLQLRSEFTSLI